MSENLLQRFTALFTSILFAVWKLLMQAAHRIGAALVLHSSLLVKASSGQIAGSSTDMLPSNLDKSGRFSNSMLRSRIKGNYQP